MLKDKLAKDIYIYIYINRGKQACKAHEKRCPRRINIGFD